MPADIVARLHDAIVKTLQIADVQQKFASFGVIPKTATSQRLAQMTAEEIARWAPVIRDNNIRAD
jgi:tripartite-type tricarboxylate transporter receptor subunit TctC